MGTTILFVTHDVDEALRIADRIVVMNAGRVVQADTPLRVFGRPATPYVEQLLDARDAVRRLQLLRVRDAMVGFSKGVPPTQAAIGADRTLREALSLLLEGVERLAVTEDGALLGTLAFDDVRDAIAATER